jgi:hypothetical protein
MAEPRPERITLLPVFHGRLEFAVAVRRALLADPPDVVAVELPGTWREPVLQAVNRLPLLSVVLGEEREGAHAFLAVEPCDPIVEALRTARELGLPVELIDLDVEHHPAVREALPDSYALARLGFAPFMEAWLAGAPHVRVAQDAPRETMMAHALQRLAADGARVTCVLGAHHLLGVQERLREPQPRPLARARARALRLHNWSERSAREFMAEPGFLAVAYERWRVEIAAALRAQPAAPARDAAAAPKAAPKVAPPKAAQGEPGRPAPEPPPPDREAEAERLLHGAAAAYAERYEQPLTPRQLRQVGTFARKYALVDGLLAPDLFQLVSAARGMVDDDYALEVWERGSAWPWEDGSGLLPTLDLSERFATVEGRRLTLHRTLHRRRPRLRAAAVNKRLREQWSGQWKARWSGRMICSHPPEDLVIEDYGRYLRHKAHAMLSAERTRVEPFQVSLKDGVDVRETLRNWHEGRLYVREQLPLGGKVGSVVVIFDTDDGGPPPPRPAASGAAAAAVVDAGAEADAKAGAERYPWCVTWLGEHAQESDMAFYATPAGEQLVGPGISRCDYGGFVMSYPPQRMADVWGDPLFDAARNKAERLLLAALDYAEERLVLYVAARPPRAWFRGVAERLGRRLVYLPLGQLNPATLRKVRSFHVLDGHHVREYADQYIR